MAVKRKNLPVIKTLLAMRYPLDYAKNNGVTAVGIAAYKGLLNILEELIDAGADIFQTSKNGIGPLYMAIKGD